MNTIEIVLTILWLLLLPYPFFMYLFYQRRKTYPIQGRFPRVALLEGLTTFVYATLYWVTHVWTTSTRSPQPETSCAVSEALFYILTLVKIHGFLYRLMQLLFCYQITKGITELKSAIRIENPNWFIRNRHLMKLPFLFKLISLQCIAYGLVLVALSTRLCTPTFQIAWGVLCGVNMGIGLWVWLKIWEFPHDVYGMKLEFKFQVAVVVVLLPLFLLLTLVFPSFLYLFDMALLLSLHFFFVPALLHPYLRSFQNLQKRTPSPKPNQRKENNNKNPKNAKKMEDGISLRTLLSHNQGVERFSKYLESEFRVENLYFYLEVQDYKKIPLQHLGELKLKANFIFNKYIDFAAPCPLSLPHTIIQRIVKQITVLLHPTTDSTHANFLTLFNEAETEIYRVMSTSSLPRFQGTQAYATLRKSGELKSASQRSLKAAGVARADENELEELLSSTPSPTNGGRGSGGGGGHNQKEAASAIQMSVVIEEEPVSTVTPEISPHTSTEMRNLNLPPTITAGSTTSNSPAPTSVSTLTRTLRSPTDPTNSNQQEANQQEESKNSNGSSQPTSPSMEPRRLLEEREDLPPLEYESPKSSLGTERKALTSTSRVSSSPPPTSTSSSPQKIQSQNNQEQSRGNYHHNNEMQVSSSIESMMSINTSNFEDEGPIIIIEETTNI